MSSHEKKRVQNRRPIKLSDEKIGVELAERLVLKHRTNRFHKQSFECPRIFCVKRRGGGVGGFRSFPIITNCIHRMRVRNFGVR